jgi:HEAT repeat protein
MSDIAQISTDSLLAEVLALSRQAPESKARQQILRALHHRGSEDIFRAAAAWSADEDAVSRALAADILAELGDLAYIEDGQTVRPFTRESLPILRQLLDDRDAWVVVAAISAIRNHDQRALITEVPANAAHSAAQVRLAMAQTLSPQRGDAIDAVAVDLLIRLMEDEETSVRDWATFSLGSVGSTDSAAVREALWRHCDDADFDTRSEALVGLAIRGDRRAVPRILAALQAETVGELVVEAAMEVGDPLLLEPLHELRSWWDINDELLESAIRRCEGKPE